MEEKILPYWLNRIFPQMSTLFTMVQQPFPDIRISAFTFLSAIAPLHWAQKHYLRSPGVIEYLTSRTGQVMDKESLDRKYGIVCALVDSPVAAELLSAENLAKLRVYRSQGPVYSDPIVSVATRDAS